MLTYRERLDKLYKVALEQKDICQAIEIADKLKDVPGAVPDERIQKFIEELDRMVSEAEAVGKAIGYLFEYGGQNFEVRIR